MNGKYLSKKTFLALVVTLATSMLFAGCGSDEARAKPEKKEKTVDLNTTWIEIGTTDHGNGIYKACVGGHLFFHFVGRNDGSYVLVESPKPNGAECRDGKADPVDSH